MSDKGLCCSTGALCSVLLALCLGLLVLQSTTYYLISFFWQDSILYLARRMNLAVAVSCVARTISVLTEKTRVLLLYVSVFQ